MSVDQGLLSPPLSGRDSKTDKPRIGALKGLNTQCIFEPTLKIESSQQRPHQHIKLSPLKLHSSTASSAGPPTPPMTCDVRHDDEHCALSGQPCSSFSDGEIEENVVRLSMHGGSKRSVSHAVVSEPKTQSDGEHDSLLERATASNSFSAQHADVHVAESIDSDQQSWSADEVDAEASDDDGDHTPHTQHSPDGLPVRLWDAPIRDTPKNPFLAGGPADQGLQGPRAVAAKQRVRELPQKERGKITYVFRGQRVTYADPEYDSDDSEEWIGDMHQGSRPARLQPKLLFPPAPLSATTSTQLVPPSRPSGGGLFASQLAKKRKLEEIKDGDSSIPPIAAGRKAQQATSSAYPDQAARHALLARLDQTDWSDDEEQDDSKLHYTVRGHNEDALESEEEEPELVKPVKRLRRSLQSHDDHIREQSQDQREVAFWLQDASHQRDTVARSTLVQRMKGR